MNYAVSIMQFLQKLAHEKNKTIAIVIHDINFAANYSDHIVALKNGKLRFSGPVKQVITAQQLDDLYELDFEITYSEQGCMCNYFNSTGA